MIDTLLSYIAPHLCYGCGKTGSVLCYECKNNIIDEPFAHCVVCLALDPTQLCASCAAGAPFVAAWTVGWREGSLLEVIDGMKFAYQRQATVACAELLDGVLPMLPALTVVPVPTSRSHVRQRGFAHAESIARRIARLRSLPYREPLERLGSLSQHRLSLHERERNASRAFRSRTIQGPVLLVDDVYTTGATVRAAARHLRDAGATAVYLAVVSRQPLER